MCTVPVHKKLTIQSEIDKKLVTVQVGLFSLMEKRRLKTLGCADKQIQIAEFLRNQLTLKSQK